MRSPVQSRLPLQNKALKIRQLGKSPKLPFSMGESYVKVHSFLLRVKSVWKSARVCPWGQAMVTLSGTSWEAIKWFLIIYVAKKVFFFSCSLVNSLLIARNFHIFTSEIFIENQQVTLWRSENRSENRS